MNELTVSEWVRLPYRVLSITLLNFSTILQGSNFVAEKGPHPPTVPNAVGAKLNFGKLILKI